MMIALVFLQITFGEMGFSLDNEIIYNLRLPKVVACVSIGGILAIAGLLMQLFFQNPLAGPDILGVSSGATFFVSLWLLASYSLPTFLIQLGISVVSLIGALLVVSLLMLLVVKNQTKATVLIIGLLIASVFSSASSLLINSANALEVKNFLLWSQGTFRRVYFEDIKVIVLIVTVVLFLLRFFLKDFSLYSLGENYAKSMGANVLRTKIAFITFTSIIIAISIYYCGPIGFIGIVAPFLAKRILKTSNIHQLILLVFIMGSMMALFSDLVQTIFPMITLNTNVVLGFIGAPVIIYYSIKQPSMLS